MLIMFQRQSLVWFLPNRRGLSPSRFPRDLDPEYGITTPRLCAPSTPHAGCFLPRNLSEVSHSPCLWQVKSKQDWTRTHSSQERLVTLIPVSLVIRQGPIPSRHKRLLYSLFSYGIVDKQASKPQFLSILPADVASSLSLWNPSHSPSMPPGFGTGHSLLSGTFCPGPISSSSGVVWPNFAMPFRTSGVSLRFHRLLRPFSSITTSPSANRAGGTGQGRMCGRATTKKLAKTVVAKRVEVVRDRG